MYRDFHSIDTAIIYNNNCKMYTSESLSDELSGLGVEVIVVNILINMDLLVKRTSGNTIICSSRCSSM